MINKLRIIFEDYRSELEEPYSEQYEEIFETLTIKEALAIYHKYDCEQTNDHQIVSVFLNDKQIY